MEISNTTKEAPMATNATGSQLIETDIGAVLPFDDVTTAEVQVLCPQTGVPLPLVIELMGPEHPERKRVGFRTARKIRDGLLKTGKPTLEDPELEDQQEPERIAELTVGWRMVNGVAPVFTRDAVTALYRNKRWLMQQMKTALDARERFIKRSAAS